MAPCVIAPTHKLVYSIMREQGLKGLPKPPTGRRGPIGAFVAADLVRRDFSGNGPNKLWVTQITEHPTKEGKVFCCAVLDAFRRKIVGWSIDSTQTAALVTNALGMAIRGRDPDRTVIHSDRGTSSQTRSSNTSGLSTTTASATARSICSHQLSSRNSIRKNPASWILVRSGRSWGLDQLGEEKSSRSTAPP